MALTQTYVDPSIAGNSGTGTLIDPYGDFQYALNTMTRDGTNGDQINIKAGTAEVLAASLTLATYGTPTSTAPLLLRGYTSAANDGGIGEIDCNNLTMWAVQYDIIHHADLEIHNGPGGGGYLINLDDWCSFVNCTLYDADRGIHADAGTLVANCYLHSFTNNRCLELDQYSHVLNCYIKHAAAYYAIYMDNGLVENTIINLSATGSFGIYLDSYAWAINNSIYNSTAGTGAGIRSSSPYHKAVINNIVEGFIGVGGIGIDIQAGDAIWMYGHNQFYNCATNLNNNGFILNDLGNDVVLGASPFAAPGSDNFMVDDTVKAVGWPTSFLGSITNQFIDAGAAQREESGGIAAWLFGSNVVRG